jgi:nucleotide-binding universal stress UspA family protein
MHIIVGVDESTQSRDALRWALRTAAQTGATVEAVRSWMYPALPVEVQPDATEMDRRTSIALEAALAAERTDGATVRATVLRGPAQHTLLGLIGSTHPDLVVVGRRGADERGATRLIGSVSRRLVEASPCPVVVVSHDPGVPADGAPVVMVAYDGSLHADRALRWAAALARRTGGRIIIAHVIGYVGAVERVELLSDRAREMLDQAAAVVADLGVTCLTAVSYGDPRRALETMADEHLADLIVAGPRGLGPIGKLVLGTVASHLSEYAERPVVMVPPAWQHDLDQ